MLNCQKVFTRLNPLARINPFGAKSAKETNIVNHKTKDIRPPAPRDPRVKLNAQLIRELKQKIENISNTRNTPQSQPNSMIATADIARQRSSQNSNDRLVELSSKDKTYNDSARFQEYFHIHANGQRKFLKSHSYPQDHQPPRSAIPRSANTPLRDDNSRPLCLRTSSLADLQMTKSIRAQVKSQLSEPYYAALQQPSRATVEESTAQKNTPSEALDEPWQNLYTQPARPSFAKTIALEEAIYADNMTCNSMPSASKGLFSRFLDFFKAIPKHFTAQNLHRA